MPGPASLVSKGRDTTASVWPGITAASVWPGPDAGPAPLASGLMGGGLLSGINAPNAHLLRGEPALLSLFRDKIPWGLPMDTASLDPPWCIGTHPPPSPNVVSFPYALFWGIGHVSYTGHSGFSGNPYQMDF